MADAIPFEKFVPVAPILGTMIAVCFDVGYFYGVGIDYFTLFSLTEHIGFALEALPYALGISIVAIFTDAVTEAPGNWSRIRKAAKGEYEYPERDLSSQIRRMLSVGALFLLFSTGALVLFWYQGLLRTFVLLCVDVDKAGRESLRGEKSKDRSTNHRRQNGQVSREEWLAANSKSRDEPWVPLNMSKATYYRHGLHKATPALLTPSFHAETGPNAPNKGILVCSDLSHVEPVSTDGGDAAPILLVTSPSVVPARAPQSAPRPENVTEDDGGYAMAPPPHERSRRGSGKNISTRSAP
jgi:hypothetical protein